MQPINGDSQDSRGHCDHQTGIIGDEGDGDDAGEDEPEHPVEDGCRILGVVLEFVRHDHNVAGLHSHGSAPEQVADQKHHQRPEQLDAQHGECFPQDHAVHGSVPFRYVLLPL